MSLQTPVPSELEAESFADLFDDCREVAAVLGFVPPRVIDLRTHVPRARLALDRLPVPFGGMPVELTDDLLAFVGGADED